MPCGVFVYEMDSSSFSLTDAERFATRDSSAIAWAARSFRNSSSETITASIFNFERCASSHKRSPSTKINSSILPSRTARACRRRELSRLVIVSIIKLLNHHFGPDGPVVGNVQRPGHAPTLNLNSAHEDPIGVHSQTNGAPRRCSGRVRRRVTTRFEKLTRLDALLLRQRIEIAEHERRHRCRFCLCRNHFKLGELAIDGRVRIDVCVKDANRLRSD